MGWCVNKIFENLLKPTLYACLYHLPLSLGHGVLGFYSLCETFYPPSGEKQAQVKLTDSEVATVWVWALESVGVCKDPENRSAHCSDLWDIKEEQKAAEGIGQC